jgi:hypothetical protein
MVLGLDVHRDRADAVIVAAAEVAGRLALEVVDQRPGTDWVLGRLLELVERHRPRALVAPAFGQARALLEQAPAQGLALEGVRTPDYVTACQMFYDLTLERRLAHRGQETLDGAVRAAGKRTVAGAWAFGSRGDISPLAAAVVAAWRASRPHIVPRLIVG